MSLVREVFRKQPPNKVQEMPKSKTHSQLATSIKTNNLQMVTRIDEIDETVQIIVQLTQK